jgi:hydroxymethylbilane synthase
LGQNAIVGTSSARRKSQVVRFRPDLEIKDLRGNVPTRIQKLREGQYDAILLAKAGVNRLCLDLSEFIEIELDPTEFVPAPAQGVLALQIRENDAALAQFLSVLNHQEVAKCIAVERAVLKKMDGGCQLPLGVYCPDEQHVYVSYSSDMQKGAVLEAYEVEDLSLIAEIIVDDLNELKA